MLAAGCPRRAMTVMMARPGAWMVTAPCSPLRVVGRSVSYTHLDVYKRQAKGRAGADQAHHMVSADVGPVSYTHLDVYKRQVLMMGRDMRPVAEMQQQLSLIHI